MQPRFTGGFVHGATIGIVCDLNDPEQMGRVRVWFPALDDEAVSFWARIRASQAGDSRGNFIRPEMGDEVLVMFEQGSMQQPFIVGCLWNGKDPIPGPGNPDGANDHKWLQTRSGHQLVFNDNAGGGWIEIHDGTQRLHTRIDVPEEWITTRADTGFIHFRAPKGTIRLECQDLNVHTTERCDVQVANTHHETVSGSRTVTIVEQDVDTRAVERFSLSTPQMTTTAKKLVTTTGQTAVRVGEATTSITPKLDMVLEGKVRRTMVDATYTVGQFRTSHDAQPSGPLKWVGEKLRIAARGSVRFGSGKNLTLIGGTVKGKGGEVTYGADRKDGQGLGDASRIAFEGGLVALNGGAGPAFPVSKQGDVLMGNCNHTTGPAPPIPAGPIPLFPYMVANPISKDTVSSIKVNGMPAAPAGATAIGPHIPPMPPPPWLPKPVNYRSSLVGAFNATFKGPLSAAVSAARSATNTVQSGESTKSVVTVEGEDAPTSEHWHLRLPPLFGQVGAFTGKLSGVSPFPVAAGQINIACQGVQATDRPLGVCVLMHAHSCSDITPPPNAMIMGGGNVVAGISASAMGDAAQWAADYAGKAYVGGAPLGHRDQRQVNSVKPGSDIVLSNETNALAPFPGFVEATSVGHPIDVGSGALFDRVLDFHWPGPIDWAWVRGYNALAASPAFGGRLGIGWRLAIEETLTRHFRDETEGADGERFFWALHTVDLRVVRLPPIAVGEQADLPGERVRYARPDAQSFVLTAADGLVRRFLTKDGATARLRAIEGPDGPLISLRWSAARLPTLTGRFGHVVELCSEPGGLAVWSVGHGEQEEPRRLVTYRFDERGRLGRVERPGDRLTEYTYDIDDRLTSEVADGYRWTFQYDHRGRVAATWGQDQRYSFVLEYLDAAQTTQVVDGLGRGVDYRWDEAHRVVGFTNADGATLIERDEHGRIVGRLEPGDRQTAWSWDTRGRLTERIDANGAVHRWRYDEVGLIEAIDPCGATLSLTRDQVGRVIRARLPDGRELLRRLDELGRPLAESLSGREATARYDSAGRLCAVTIGEQTLDVAYDNQGRVSRIADSERGTVHLSHDDAGQLIERETARGVERWTHTATGAVSAYIDPDGRPWALLRDPLGRTVGARAPSGAALTSERGIDDRYRWHSTADGTRWAYDYDDCGRLRSHEVDGVAHRVVRDRVGRLSAIQAGARPLLAVKTDAMGRPSAVRLADGDGWTIARDACGRPLTATARCRGRAYPVAFRRDVLGRVIEESGPLGAVRARYGPHGLSSIMLNGVGLSIERDAAGRPTRIDTPDGLHTLEWSGPGWTARGPSGLTLTGGRPGWALRGRNGELLARYDAERDGHGRLVGDRLCDTRGERWSRRFERDTSGRLAGRYDDADNRVRPGWTIAAGQRLLADVDGAIEHDDKGRVVRFGGSEAPVALTWDPVGRLILADTSEQIGVEWGYDPFGRPVKQWVRPPGRAAEVRSMHWWGDRLLAFGPEGSEAEALHLPLAIDDAQPWATWVDGALWRWLVDARSAVIGAVCLSPGEHRVWWAPAADVWGAPKTAPDALPPCSGPLPALAGMWHLPAADLMLNRFRWYRSAWGRYLSPDPLEIGGGTLRYGYARNDPTRYVDMLGLSCADPQARSSGPSGGRLMRPSSALPTSAPAQASSGVAPSLDPAGPTEQPLMPSTTPRWDQALVIATPTTADVTGAASLTNPFTALSDSAESLRRFIAEQNL